MHTARAKLLGPFGALLIRSTQRRWFNTWALSKSIPAFPSPCLSSFSGSLSIYSLLFCLPLLCNSALSPSLSIPAPYPVLLFIPFESPPAPLFSQLKMLDVCRELCARCWFSSVGTALVSPRALPCGLTF